MSRMARITVFTRIAKDRVGRHTGVECGFAEVEYDRKLALLLETYGSDERQISGKTSQSLLLQEESAARLVEIIQSTFPSLGRACVSRSKKSRLTVRRSAPEGY